MCTNEANHQPRLQNLDARLKKGISAVKGIAASTVPSRWSWLLTIKDLLKPLNLKEWGGESELCVQCFLIGWCTTFTDFSGWAPMDLQPTDPTRGWCRIWLPVGSCSGFEDQRESCYILCRVLALEVDKRKIVKTKIQNICLTWLPFAWINVFLNNRRQNQLIPYCILHILFHTYWARRKTEEMQKWWVCYLREKGKKPFQNWRQNSPTW